MKIWGQGPLVGLANPRELTIDAAIAFIRVGRARIIAAVGFLDDFPGRQLHRRGACVWPTLGTRALPGLFADVSRLRAVASRFDFRVFTPTMTLVRDRRTLWRDRAGPRGKRYGQWLAERTGKCGPRGSRDALQIALGVDCGVRPSICPGSRRCGKASDAWCLRRSRLLGEPHSHESGHPLCRPLRDTGATSLRPRTRRQDAAGSFSEPHRRNSCRGNPGARKEPVRGSGPLESRRAYAQWRGSGAAP